MSFPSKRAARCLDNQFQYCLLTRCIKTPAVFKCQQFEDTDSDVTEPSALKRLRMDEHDNEEGQSSDKYQDKSGRYVRLLPRPRKESNRLTDLGEGIRSLNHLVCIPKLSHPIIANLMFEFPGRGGSKARKNLYLPLARGDRVPFGFHNFLSF